MAHPTSFRLSADLLERLDEEAASKAMSVTALVTSILDEGLKTRRFPGITYRDGPTGRRAGIVGGPDVWEIVRALKRQPDAGETRVRNVAGETGVPLVQIRLAIDFYGANVAEVDERIALDDRAAEHMREAINQRERLLSA